MSKILAAVFISMISQFAMADDRARTHVNSIGVRETVVTNVGYESTDPIGQLKIAEKITKIYREKGEIVVGKPVQPLEALVMVDVILDSKGNLISATLGRGGAITSIHDQRAVNIVRNSAPFHNVPEYYKGGKFVVTFLFEKRPHATAVTKFKMQMLDKDI